MQIKMFTIPITGVDDQNEELNKFLRSHKIMEIEKQMVQTATSAYWCLYITYTTETARNYVVRGENGIDYKELLKPEQFEIFSKFREVRKRMSVEDSIKAYIIFTDAELAEMSRMADLTVNNMRLIKGIGDKKAEKYGQRLLDGYNDLK